MIKYSDLYKKELDRRHDEIIELRKIAGKVAQYILKEFEQKFNVFYPFLVVEVKVEYNSFYPENSYEIIGTKEIVNDMVLLIIRELGYNIDYSLMYNSTLTTFKIWGDKL